MTREHKLLRQKPTEETTNQFTECLNTSKEYGLVTKEQFNKLKPLYTKYWDKKHLTLPFNL